MNGWRRLAMAGWAAALLACSVVGAPPATLAPPTAAPATAIPATRLPPTPRPSALPAPTELPPTLPAPTDRPPTEPPPEHHIGVRVVAGVGEFYNRLTGERFVPRGNNYIRLGPQTKPDGSPTFGHALFDPDQYDPARVGADLAKMQADGYNVVRVFFSPDTLETAGGAWSRPYLNNVVDFLEQARQYSLYVIFTLDWIAGAKYGEILSAECCETFALMNANLLPGAGLRANQAFWADLARELLERGAATEHIFAYQLRNELYFDADQPPLSFGSGVVTAANGQNYDMAVAADKDRMVAEGLVYWLDEVRAAIRAVDPTALVGVGFFVPQGPHPARLGDPRLAVTEPAIWQSQVDFVDLHAYAGFELNLGQHVDNFGVNGMQAKPIIMGEFGGEVSRFPDITTAAFTFRDWQVESCAYGFDGWLFWTWDTDEQPDFFNTLMAGGAINGVLAPVARPDPCVP